jgi:hypothetical protein
MTFIIQTLEYELKFERCQVKSRLSALAGHISIYCNFSLAPGFSPVGVVGPTASRFNGLVTAARKTVETVPIFSIRHSPG